MAVISNVTQHMLDVAVHLPTQSQMNGSLGSYNLFYSSTLGGVKIEYHPKF